MKDRRYFPLVCQKKTFINSEAIFGRSCMGTGASCQENHGAELLIRLAPSVPMRSY